MSYCKVAECRFSSSHVTKGHKCGSCGGYGHGEIECNDPYLKNELKKWYNHILPTNLHCTVTNCRYKSLHNSDAHHCPNCDRRVNYDHYCCYNSHYYNNNDSSYYVSTIYKVKCPICRVDNIIKNPSKIYGISNQCCICLESNAEILFSQCNHVPICMVCLTKMN